MNADRQVTLKPQDVVVVLKMAVSSGHDWTYASLGEALALSASEVHKAVGRCVQSGLILRRSGRGRASAVTLAPSWPALVEFLQHGLAYAFPAVRGELTRGIATGFGAPPLREQLLVPPDEPPPVWPLATGPTRGFSLTPLYPGVPVAALADGKLYECLTLIDAIRMGRARERTLARRLLGEILDRARPA